MNKKIFMVATSNPITLEDITITKLYFENEGMEVIIPENILGKDIFCSNEDKIRLSHLTSALLEPSIDIIMMLSGGYGMTRLIPDLLKLQKPPKEKLFIGFSDGTPLHILLNQIWDWPSLHGAGAPQIAKRSIGDKTIEATLKIIKEGFKNYIPPSLKALNKNAKNISSLSGKVIGGNLCLIENSLGTNWQINAEGKILFLEEVGERGYRVDRMLTHLNQAAVFKNLNAIIFGEFIKCNEPNGTTLIPAVLKRFAENVNIPVFTILDCGHGKENFPLPLNINLNFSIK